MGGEAAKERRRLKRLEAQKQEASAADGKEINNDAPNTQTKKNDKNKTDDQLIRFQRKQARKASGKFKPQAQGNDSDVKRSPYTKPPSYNKNDSDVKRSPYTKPPSYTYNKRKSEDTAKMSSPHKRMNQASPKNLSGRSDRTWNQSGRSDKHNRNNSNNKQTSEKMKTTKPKVQKPKHLKRKMDQLSQTISSATTNNEDTTSQLEDQMKQLAKQMEEYKDMKNKNSDKVVVTEDESKKEKSIAISIEEDGENKTVEKEGPIDSDNKNNNESPDDYSKDAEDTMSSKANDKELTPPVATSSSPSSSSSDDDNDESDSSSDDVSNTRSRGKRRRGRKSLVDAPPETTRELTDSGTPKKEDKRRCIGRKPITDYTIGKTYSGTVKYIKPKLGAFIDIGCHSDAFCHISCTSDEYVSSVTDILNEDDVVENVRVVEIDREKKRITVSLRREEMAKDENDRLQSTRQYEQTKSRGANSTRYGNSRKYGEGTVVKSTSLKKDSKAKADIENGGSEVDPWPIPTPNMKMNSSAAWSEQKKTGVDLKRERKLARRAERRAANEATM